PNTLPSCRYGYGPPRCISAMVSCASGGRKGGSGSRGAVDGRAESTGRETTPSLSDGANWGGGGRCTSRMLHRPLTSSTRATTTSKGLRIGVDVGRVAKSFDYPVCRRLFLNGCHCLPIHAKVPATMHIPDFRADN